MNDKEKAFWHNCFEVFYGSEADNFESQCGLIECICIRENIIEMLNALLKTYGDYSICDLAKLITIEFQRTIGYVNFDQNTISDTLELAVKFDILYDKEIENYG